MRTIQTVKAELDELTAKRDELVGQADALKDRSEPNQQEHRHRLVAGSANLQGQIDRLTTEWGELLLRGVEDGRFSTESADPEPAQRAERVSGGYSNRSQVESGALRAVELHKSELTSEAGDRLERVIRDAETDPMAIGARYLAAVGNQHYRSAFWRILRDPTFGHLEMTPAETDAVRTVRHVEQMRAMSLTGSAGGFAVPFDLDPSIMLTNAGAVNPLRQVATVKTIAVDEWRGVSSAGVTAAYAAEATETTDNAPTLAQPTISTEKAQAFIPFSIEVGMDWGTLEAEMAGLLRDAKDNLESTKFSVGSGTNEPFGVVTGATNTVNATAAGVVDAEDVYRLQEALPARYQERARYMASGTIKNRIYRLVGGGSTEPPLVSEDQSTMLGKPFLENSAMATVTTVGALFLLYGDFSRFVIVDRIGLSIELIPHLVGTNHRPTGQRGIFAFWRNSSKVVDAGAFRILIGLA